MSILQKCKAKEWISGEGFLRFSGIGVGSLGRRRSFRVMTGLISIESEMWTKDSLHDVQSVTGYCDELSV